MDEPGPLRVPISVASRKGVSWVNDTAHERRVVLTKHGRADAVIDSAERLDRDAVRMREAARSVVEVYADRARDRAASRSLEDVCAELGVDADRIRRRASALRQG